MIAKLSSKKGRLELWNGAKYSVQTVVGMPKRVTGMARQLLREGGFSIEKSFEYQEYSFTISTFIQPDADMVTVIGIGRVDGKPLNLDLSKLEVDAAGEAKLMKHYFAHKKEVEEAFEGLDGRLKFWGTAIDVSLVTTNLYSVATAFAYPEEFDGKADLGFYVIDVPQLLYQISPDVAGFFTEPGIIATVSAATLASVSLFARKYLRKHGSALIISALFKLVSWYLERRSKK